MTQTEREYFEELKKMDIDAELRKALYIDQITEDENGNPLEHPIVDLAQYTESFDVIVKNLESKIAESKTKIFMNFMIKRKKNMSILMEILMEYLLMIQLKAIETL